MMLFTASSTTLQFTLLGMIDWEKNFVLPLVGAAGAAFGQQMIGRLVKKYNRQSLIIFPVAGIIGLSAVLMGYTSLVDLWHNGMGGMKGARPATSLLWCWMGEPCTESYALTFALTQVRARASEMWRITAAAAAAAAEEAKAQVQVQALDSARSGAPE
jgi:hypothetical protein